MDKLCECGCKRPTKVIDRTINKMGRKRGQFNRFIVGHNINLRAKITHCKYGHEYTPENTERRKRKEGGFSRRCKQCNYARMLKKYYQISPDFIQGKSCEICGKEKWGLKNFDRPQVDHDHSCCPGARSCGKCIRGILCNNCNRALGILGDHNIQNALSYITKYQTSKL